MSKVLRVEVNFPTPVELPDGWDRVLCDLVDMVCKKWEAENPMMVMWPAGIGSKITSMGIAAGDEHIDFDDNTFAIDCCAREDYHGNNPANPERERLRAEAAAERKARKANVEPAICPHATSSPLRYCDPCPVSPCPMETPHD